MSIQLKEVHTKRDIKSFIDFQYDLYKNDKNYVPPLYIAEEEKLNKKKNPFFQHSEAQYWSLHKNGKMVGRIAAVLNNEYNKYHESNIGFFGFFDCVNNQEIANILLSTAEGWLKEKGVVEMHGPTNFTTNETSGLLIDGFDSPPVVEMTYNFPYYQDLLEAYHFDKEMDLFAYYIPTKTASEKSLRLSAMLEERLERSNISFRQIDMRNFKSEVKLIKELYKAAWEKNWGFVPPTDAEFDVLAEGLKFIVDSDYTVIAEQDGKAIGFAIALPNINEILINVKRGRLFPFGIFKLLMGKKKTKVVRVTLLGVIEKFRNKGIEGVFFAKLIRMNQVKNKLGGEASWILENNKQMVRAAENLNGEKYKTYRIFSKKIS